MKKAKKAKAKTKVKAKKGKNGIEWLDQPEPHNYPAAKAYLGIIFEGSVVDGIVKKLKNAPISEFKAKDIFRASSLSLLGTSNLHVEKDRRKIKNGVKISPLLLVRHSPMGKVIIADGYHRLCAIYSFNEDAVIPCKIV